jgi:hypothetical protein
MNGFEKKQKVGRNDPCPCGSGKKFKKCHGGVTAQFSSMPTPDPEALKIKLEQIAAIQKQRQQQQGFGKSIISTVFQGYRIMAVGSKLFHSLTWKTFHDFLFDYMKLLLGSECCGDGERAVRVWCLQVGRWKAGNVLMPFN